MANKQRDYKREEKNRNGKNITIRVDDGLLELFDSKRKKYGKSRRELIIGWIEDYCFEEEN